MSREVWETVETKARKVRVVEAEGRRKEGRRGKEMIREGIKKRKRKEGEKTQE